MKKIIFLTIFVLSTMVGCNNLQWSEKAPNAMSWYEAKQYCENLDEGGHSDWKLPNIDELRTLIKAPETISGGKCQISEKTGKLSSEDYTEECGNSTSKLGDRYSFWSSSTPSDSTNGAWIVNFSYGDVDSDNKNSHKQSVRCVR